MKKRLALLLAAVLIGTAGVGAVIDRLQGTREAVRLDERVLLGDPAAASGITVTVRSQLDGHLFWTTAYEVGGKAQTEYRFYANEQREAAAVSSVGLRMWGDLREGVNLAVPADEQTGFAKLFREMYDAAEEDALYEREVRLRDVYAYYPIRIRFDIPGVFWTGNDPNALMEDGEKTEKYVNNYLQNYFKIPVLDEETYTLFLRKDRDGFSTSMDRSSADGFDLSSVSAYTAYGEGAQVTGTVYFAFSDRTSAGARVDTSQIEGGRAVYQIPYAYGLGYADTGLDVDALAPVYSLAPDEDVREMMTTEDGAYLILLTERTGETCLTVLSTETHQVLNAYSLDKGLYRTAYFTGDLLILRFESGFTLFERDETGYALRFFCPEADDVSLPLYSKHAFFFDYDGERLAVVGYLATEERYDAACGFSLAVYGEEGLRYYGMYESSLDASSRYGNGGVTLASFSPLTVTVRKK